MTTATKPKRPTRATRQGDGVVVLVWREKWVRADCETALVRRWRTADDIYRVEQRTDTYGEPLVRYIALRLEGSCADEPHYGLVGTIEAKRRRRRGDRLIYRREYLRRLRRQAMRLCEEDANGHDGDG